MPEKGARIVLRAIVARISPTRGPALRVLRRGLVVVRLRDDPLLARRPLIRSKLIAGELPLRLGGGQLRLLLTRVELHEHRALPHGLPGLEVRSRSTIPGRSALTVTPCTAATVPMAVRFAGHCSCRATIVVTASGGGWNEECWAIAFLTWPYFTAPMAVRKAAAASSIRIIRFFIGVRPPISTREPRTGGAPPSGCSISMCRSSSRTPEARASSVCALR